MFNPFTRQRLPRVPGPIGVLQRALMAGQSLERIGFGPLDTMLQPNLPAGVSFAGFEMHTSIFNAAYRSGLETIDKLTRAHDPALLALMSE